MKERTTTTKRHKRAGASGHTSNEIESNNPGHAVKSSRPLAPGSISIKNALPEGLISAGFDAAGMSANAPPQKKAEMLFQSWRTDSLVAKRSAVHKK